MIYSDIRESLVAAGAELRARFEVGESVVELVHARAAFLDGILVELWREHLEPLGAALVAVGGYGRGELHPCSDVDVMLLLPDEIDAGSEDPISSFVTALWDIGLEAGHSVRNLAQCREEASMQDIIGPDEMWPSDRFFEEKRKEQIARHHRYHDTAYNLEPNVKGSPGGLRDIQMIGWVAKRHFGAATLAELVEHKFLSPGQLQRLEDGQAFLWRIRFALHILTGRREDRLLFDHQKTLAEMLGYEDATYTLAVEQLMQRYYRTVMELSRLNEMLLQLFEEAILMDPNAPAEPLTECFQVKNGFLQTVDDQVFRDDPSALAAAGASRHPGRQRVHRWAHQTPPVPDRRRIPAEPAQSPPVPVNSPRTCGRNASTSAHESLRGPRPVHSGVWTHRRSHAV
jgi:[protein-PII] uridylyltransferase